MSSFIDDLDQLTYDELLVAAYYSLPPYDRYSHGHLARTPVEKMKFTRMNCGPGGGKFLGEFTKQELIDFIEDVEGYRYAEKERADPRWRED